MRDPRNWVRPAAAAVVGVSAGTALVVLRVRARHRVRKQRSGNVLELAQRTLHDVAEEATAASCLAASRRVASVQRTGR